MSFTTQTVTETTTTAVMISPTLISDATTTVTCHVSTTLFATFGQTVTISSPASPSTTAVTEPTTKYTPIPTTTTQTSTVTLTELEIYLQDDMGSIYSTWIIPFSGSPLPNATHTGDPGQLVYVVDPDDGGWDHWSTGAKAGMIVGVVLGAILIAAMIFCRIPCLSVACQHKMWQDDEDNNPYGSFNNQDSATEPSNPTLSTSYPDSVQPTSPTSYSTSSNQASQFRDDDDEEQEEEDERQAESGPVPPKGGYDSRVQQILYEQPDLEIVITDAGKSADGGYIVYKIRTGDIEVARRYSEFSSLRAALINLHPTLIIPPIPEKHTMADYAAKPTKAKEDVGIIDQRKRMLAVFLNRCRRMKEVVEDGVWWRFLDPNSSWNEVLHAHPVSSVPKNNLKAPPLDPANPTPAHNWLPIPSSSAKLRPYGPTSSTGTPISPPDQTFPSVVSHTTPGPQIFGRFPVNAERLSETDLDPYFINFEQNTRELEILLQGSIEKVNRRTIEHLTKLSADLAELGARYNGFSLSEQSPTVAAAIERIGQAVDSTYISTEELSLSLGATFAEPMRESAQFAGVVRNVLKYRVLKRVQQEMTREDLEKKRYLLDQLERSESEAKRIDAYLAGSTTLASPPRRSTSSASARGPPERRDVQHEETESVDSDFPPTHGEPPLSPPSAAQGQPHQNPTSPTTHRKSPSGNFVTNKIFGSFRHAVNGFVDVDPERTRRDQIGKTRESLSQLEQALEVSEKDVHDATQGVMRDLKRFQKEKEDDLQRYMDRESYNSDVEMSEGQIPGSGSGFTPINSDTMPSGSQDTLKAKQQDTGLRHRDIRTTDQLTHTSDARAVQQSAASSSDNSASSTTTDSLFPSPSNRSTAATSLDADVPPTATSIPSIDDQIAQVTALWQKELEEGQKGYLISAKWFQKVQARSSVPGDVGRVEKSATEGEIGPVDNSDIAMVIDEDARLTDEAGEKYVPLRPGLTLDEDYRVFPQEAWDLIISWYGLAKDSPVITRYAHDWSGADATMPNVTWELNPPLFSFLKVPSEHTIQTQRESDLPPQRMIASKKTLCNDWLKEGKKLLHIDMNTKVRVWRILGGLKNASASGGLTPAASRSASPAPGVEIVATAGDKMLLDVNTFVHLQVGEHRELLTEIKDNTANPNYNGKTSTLSFVGLGRNEEVIVLEEQKSGKDEWPSESSKLNLAKGIRGAAKNLTPSGRSSPAPGMMTRGRQKRDGRPRGITGLSNLGNTCYMNSALQCIRSVEELTQYFLHDQWKQDLNVDNPLGHHGEIAKAYANLLHQIYDENASSTNPSRFKAIVGKYGSNFSGYSQQDSQEFLLFLLDGLQEDLNRIQKKPYIEKPDSTDDMVHDSAALQAFAQKNWEIYKARNDSVVTDLFAGMYKSTLTCPVCNKVSIIFDPFNNLTLQLPIENNWQKEILYFPLRQRPIRIDIDIDKHSTIKALKEFVALRTHADVDRLLVAESYKNKIYKIFDNNIVISEASIQANDIICVYELESVPTNYNPNKPRKFSLYMSRSDADEDVVDADSPEADRLLVPIFNRLVKHPARTSSKLFFGQPTYLVLSREDRATYDGVLKKILGNVMGMTTKSILDEEYNPSDDGIGTPEGSDTMVMTDDMSSSGSGLPTATSVQGEDGLVDVSMRDASQAPELRPQPAEAGLQKLLQSNSPLPRRFQQLFDVQVVATGEGVPTGWSQLSETGEYVSIKTRIPKPTSRTMRPTGALAFANGESGSAESDDELADIENDDTPMDSNESGSEASPVLPSGPESESEFQEPQEILPSRNKKAHKYGKNKNRGKVSARRPHRRSPLPPPQPIPQAETGDFVRPGEIIILDWSQEGYDALFGGNEDGSEGFRGLPTWKSVGLLPDPEISAKREQRNNRKKNGITLIDCLNEFGKSETLSEQNAWYCPRCKEHRRADKMFELWKAPDILVMHLKRFSSNRSFRDKLEVKVDYPTEGLDLSEMVRDQQDGKSMIYDLIAVDNHYGGLGGGHYTAFAKNFYNNSWYEYNDSHVSSKPDPRSVVTSAAYLLFYRRRSDHPLGGPKLQEALQELNPNSNDAAADSELPQDSRDSSPMTGEGQRLGDSSHNGSSGAFPVGHGHRVGAGPGGSAQEEGSRQARGLLAGTESPPNLTLPTAASSGGEYEQPPAYDIPPPEIDEGVGMDFQWSRQSWDFARLDGTETTSQRAPANSEVEGVFGDKGSSNDSTRVEGNDCSPVPSFTDLEDDGSIHHDPSESDMALYSSEAGRVLPHEEPGHGRDARESAPPPDEIVSEVGTSGRGMSMPVTIIVDDDNDDIDDPPVMELQADPANNHELSFNPAT
ncbi:hypothetical protein AYL99_06752 [Fonsecaea erecta]|uniref:Uncharacterized protein n=1 Tax=Fonsecaea erecta TaxID=1367422 RepID=A0A178ZI14_9EURO|nr:hypothetical protein AYL99_06752 [Fonsecaea erecta]OAP59454.1 hypothetical protein AYL99_06752 [Fonsecaea erecta]